MVALTVQLLHGGGESGSSNTGTAQVETTVSGNTATAATSTTATVDSNGKATASVTQAQMRDVVNQAVSEVEKQENVTIAVAKITVEADADAKLVDVLLPTIAVDAAAKSNVDALTVSTPVASITFEKKLITQAIE